MAAPLYALLVFVLLLVPYQLAGNGTYLVGIIVLVMGRFMMTMDGRELAKPLSLDQVLPAVRAARFIYFVCTGVAGILVFVAFYELLSSLDLSVTTMLTMLLGPTVGIWLLTTCYRLDGVRACPRSSKYCGRAFSRNHRSL